MLLELAPDVALADPAGQAKQVVLLEAKAVSLQKPGWQGVQAGAAALLQDPTGQAAQDGEAGPLK